MGRITEILNSIRVVKAFANEDYEKDRFKKQQDKYYSLITRRAKLKLTASPITETIGAMIGSYYYGLEDWTFWFYKL